MNTEIWTPEQKDQLEAINRLLGKSSQLKSASGNESEKAKADRTWGLEQLDRVVREVNWRMTGGQRASIYAGVIIGEWGAGWVQACGHWVWEEHGFAQS